MQTTITELDFADLQESDLPQENFVLLHGDNYTILGQNPVATIQVFQTNWQEHLNKLDQLNEYLASINQFQTDLPFSHGLLGFFSYDFGNLIHAIQHTKTTDAPLSYWIIPKTITVWDHQASKKILIEHCFNVIEQQDISTLVQYHDETPKLQSQTISQSEYNQKIATIKEQLINGESYQINFAQQFTSQQKIDPIKTFWKINKLNPSPYQALIKTKNFSVISNSPELLLAKNGSQLTTKPIKGTIPKTENPETLKSDPKTISELTMIVDMSRNDLGQISKPGTIKVSGHQQIQELSHVIHTYSTITATAKNQLTLAEVIPALFPGASVTGCPKRRTMELIAELEPSARGVYCGSAGYINHNLDLQLNIMIRTLWYNNQEVSLHSGGGIVIDSQTESEYQETLHKAQAFLTILHD